MAISRICSDPREAAVRCCLEVEKHGVLVPEAMNRLPLALEATDRALATELVYGCFRYFPGLNRVLSKLCRVKKLPPLIRWLLLASLYQLMFTRIPAYAVLNEANRLARQMGFAGLKPLVNGVLRNADRQSARLFSALTPAEWLLPDWLTGMFLEQYGETALADWLEQWRGAGTMSYWSANRQPFPGDQASKRLPFAYRGERPLPQAELVKRRIYIQNESSQAIAECVRRSGLGSVLDFCAAPGGKVCYLAAFGAWHRLTAHDPAASRISLLRGNRDRLGLRDKIEIVAKAEDLGDRQFELVLVDAPCSGIGIIGRHPEIKVLKSGRADKHHRRSQRDILRQAWRLVAAGGFLLYTICSLDQAEVPDFPQDALQAGEEARAWMPPNVPVHFQEARFRMGPSSDMDGFLGCLMRKPSS